MTLKNYRQQINAIDKSLLLLVRSRQEAAKQIGLIKKETKKEIYDVSQEVRSIKDNAEFSESLGLGKEIAEDLTKVLMFHSKLLQELVQKKRLIHSA